MLRWLASAFAPFSYSSRNNIVIFGRLFLSIYVSNANRHDYVACGEHEPINRHKKHVESHQLFSISHNIHSRSKMSRIANSCGVFSVMKYCWQTLTKRKWWFSRLGMWVSWHRDDKCACYAQRKSAAFHVSAVLSMLCLVRRLITDTTDQLITMLDVWWSQRSYMYCGSECILWLS